MDVIQSTVEMFFAPSLSIRKSIPHLSRPHEVIKQIPFARSLSMQLFQCARKRVHCIHGPQSVIVVWQNYPTINSRLNLLKLVYQIITKFTGHLSNCGLAIRCYSEGGQVALLNTILGEDNAAILCCWL